MIKYLGAAIAAAASLGLAGQASATIHNLVYSGHVTEALDLTGEFGLGANLVGKAFTAHVTYDDNRAGATHIGDVWYDYYTGNGAANPVTISILLNGVTLSVGATDGTDLREDRSLLPGCTLDCTTGSFEQSAEDRFIQNNLYTLNYVNLGGSTTDGTISGLAHTAPDFTNPPVDLYGFVNVFQQKVDTLENTKWAEVSVKIDSVHGGVPEPAAWSLMLVGFGGLGAAVRARRRSLASF